MNVNKVWTPNGYLAGPVNSLVGKGESIIDYTNGTGTLVTKGKVGVDNQPSSVLADDQNVIAGNDIDWSTGRKFSDQIAPLTAKLQMYNNIEKKVKENKLSSLSKLTMQLQNSQLQRAKAPILSAMKNITDRQETQHKIEDYEAYAKANRGIDKFDTGKGQVPIGWLNAGAATGMAAEGLMLDRWLKEQPLMPNIYAANRYAPSALLTLNKLRVDPYNLLQALNKAEREAYYRMQQSGGYTGGLRLNSRVALALGNARSASDIYNKTQLQNDQYRQNWATAALAEGNQDAARRLSASQYAWEAYNKAHGAKIKGIETHLAALAAKGQKYWADRIKNKQYEDTLSLYQQDVNNKRDAINLAFSNYGGATMSGDNKPNTSAITLSSNPATRISSPQTLTLAISGIAPGWTPGGYRFITPQLQQAMNAAYDNSVKTMADARNKLESNRLMMGDYGLGRYFFNIPIMGSLFTNKTYLDSRLPNEVWAGPDGEFAPIERYPLTWGGVQTR